MQVDKFDYLLLFLLFGVDNISSNFAAGWMYFFAFFFEFSTCFATLIRPAFKVFYCYLTRKTCSSESLMEWVKPLRSDFFYLQSECSKKISSGVWGEIYKSLSVYLHTIYAVVIKNGGRGGGEKNHALRIFAVKEESKEALDVLRLSLLTFLCPG